METISIYSMLKKHKTMLVRRKRIILFMIERLSDRNWYTFEDLYTFINKKQGYNNNLFNEELEKDLSICLKWFEFNELIFTRHASIIDKKSVIKQYKLKIGVSL